MKFVVHEGRMAHPDIYAHIGKFLNYRVFRSDCRIMKLCSSQTTEANDFIFFQLVGNMLQFFHVEFHKNPT